MDVTFVSVGQRAFALAVVQAFPLYQPLTVRHLAHALGIERVRRTNFHLHGADSARLHYPLAPIRVRKGAPRSNIVWLACESLRYDMLTPEIMPATFAFARQSTWFRNHVSGGNGTRDGQPLADEQAWQFEHQARLVAILNDLRRFVR